MLKCHALRTTLLASSSALAIVMALDGAAAAQCASQNTAPVTNTTPSNCITFYDGAAHTGDVINNSTLTPTGTYSPGMPGTATGISVLKLGTTLTGNIINNGTINASTVPGKQYGINIGVGATNSVNQNAGAVLNGSITNAGTITGSSGIEIGGNSTLFSTATGSIINAAGGQINYTGVGISLGYATVGGSITNAGTISGTGTAGINVAWSNLGGPGSGNIVNATGAKIASSYIGIVVNGNSGTATGATIAGSIINNGNITAPNQNTGQGIEVAAAAVLGGITNSGTITAAIGIELFGANEGGFNKIASVAGNIINQGQINAVSTNGSSGGVEIFGFDGGGPAIVGGSIVNSGSIRVSGASGTNDGILLAGAHLAGGITNTNTISVGGGTVNVGIAVANSAFANFSSANSSIGGSIVNLGTIIAGTGILVSGGSRVSGGIIDSGTINGSVAAINLTGEGAATQITVSGGTAVINGNIVGNGLSAGDALNFQIGANNTFTYNSNFSAIDQVNVATGTVVLNGNANSAAMVSIENGGILQGTGTIATAMTVQSGGAFAPGTAGVPGTSMNITGSLAFVSGALYVVYLNPTTSSYANVSGTASLNGTAQANFAPGSYMQKQYTILQTSGGLNGTAFTGLATNGLPPGFSTNLSYNADDVFLNLTAVLGLSQQGLNQNQRNVATTLNNFFNSGGALPPGFASLFGLTGGNLGNALTALDGEDATGAERGAFDLMTEFLDLMLDPNLDGRFGSSAGGPLGFAPDQQASLPPDIALAYASLLKAPPKQTFAQRWTAWAAGFGGSATTNGDPVIGSNTVTTSTSGYAAGLDYHYSPDTVFGFSLAGGGTNWNLANALGTGRSDAFLAGVYGVTHDGPWYLGGALAFANNWFTTNRTAFAGDQLMARFQGQSYAARLEGGYRFTVPMDRNVVGITPYAAIQAQNFHTPAYSETDLTGGGFGLSYNAMNGTDTRSELGGRFDDLTALGAMPLILRAKVAWAHDWVSNPALNASFESLPGTAFTVNGAPIPHDSALATAGAQLFFTPNWSLLAKFDGEFASGSQLYAGSGTLRYTW